MKRYFDFSHFKLDLLGGITAGIVALPLALAFGEQSGLGAASGLYGAAFIAFFAALFGGTATQISGPTAPMTALSMIIIAGIVQACEGEMSMALPMILSVFVLAGFIQIFLGVIKMGTYVKYIPYPVVSGFMTGIGIIILITQIPPMLGYYSGEDQQLVEQFMPHGEELILDRILKEEAETGILVLDDIKETVARAAQITDEHKLEEAQVLATNDGKGVTGALMHLDRALTYINWMELMLALATILIIYGFKRITTVVPSTLVALVTVSAAAYFMGLDYRLIQEIPTGFPAFQWISPGDLDMGILTPFLLSAFTLALLGAIDSLLTSLVADNLTKTQHDPNQELIGQGIGNSIAAFFGGLPGAGATIRTVVNINAGGKTRISGMVAGLFLFCILIILGPIASTIPAAVLAGILVTVGIGVMDYRGLKALPKMEWNEKVILITVLLLTVFWQLVYAVGVGLIMAAFVFLKRMSDLSTEGIEVKSLVKSDLWGDEMELDETIRKRVLFKHLNGPIFFGIVNDFKNLFSKLPEADVLIIRMERVPFIDQSGLYALEEAIQALQRRDVVVAISCPNKPVRALLSDLNLVPGTIPDRLVFSDFVECKKWLRAIIIENEEAKKAIKSSERLNG